MTRLRDIEIESSFYWSVELQDQSAQKVEAIT